MVASLPWCFYLICIAGWSQGLSSNPCSTNNMDRRDRQSSLPSSLIPHLYDAPRDSSTRTTLSSHSEDSDQGGSNISSLPLLPPIPPYIRPSSSNPFIADDRQLPPVLPAYRSLEPSNPHRSVSPTYSNQTPFFPSSRSSPTSILLPSLASLSADIFPRNSSRRDTGYYPTSHQCVYIFRS